MSHVETVETALDHAIHENDELRAEIRNYARELRDLAAVTRDAGGSYLAHTYDQIATTLERKIGDRT